MHFLYEPRVEPTEPEGDVKTPDLKWVATGANVGVYGRTKAVVYKPNHVIGAPHAATLPLSVSVSSDHHPHPKLPGGAGVTRLSAS